jgi:hypothetical protein
MTLSHALSHALYCFSSHACGSSLGQHLSHVVELELRQRTKRITKEKSRNLVAKEVLGQHRDSSRHAALATCRDRVASRVHG